MISNLIHNLIEQALEALRQPPRLCHARKGANSYCDGCESGNTFLCQQCKRLMPWCCGAGDANFDYCDDCVATFPECERCGENLDTPMLEIDMYCRKCWDYYKQPEGWGLE